MEVVQSWRGRRRENVPISGDEFACEAFLDLPRFVAMVQMDGFLSDVVVIWRQFWQDLSAAQPKA